MLNIINKTFINIDGDFGAKTLAILLLAFKRNTS